MFSNETLKQLITKESLSQIDATAKITQDIKNKYRAVGYHFCEVTVKSVEDKQSRVTIKQFDIYEHDKVLIDRVYINGGEELGAKNIEKMFFENPG